MFRIRWLFARGVALEIEYAEVTQGSCEWF